MTTTPERKTPEQVIDGLQDELEYRVRTAVARWKSRAGAGPSAQSLAVTEEVKAGRKRVGELAGLLVGDPTEEREMAIIAEIVTDSQIGDRAAEIIREVIGSRPEPTPEDRVATPAEPGLYVDRLGNVWQLYQDGVFAMSSRIRASAAHYAPFKRLVVAEDGTPAAGVAPHDRTLAARIRKILDRDEADDEGSGQYIDPKGRRLQIANRTIARVEATLHEVVPQEPSDTQIQRVREAVFAQSQRERGKGAGGSGLYYPSSVAAETIIQASGLPSVGSPSEADAARDLINAIADELTPGRRDKDLVIAARELRQKTGRANECGVPHPFRPVVCVLPEGHEPGHMCEKPAPSPDREKLRIDDDYQHIYWFDPVEGCWVAYRRADCVGEEELPQRILAAPTPVDEASES